MDSHESLAAAGRVKPRRIREMEAFVASAQRWRDFEK
jgi:hypothetical protein